MARVAPVRLPYNPRILWFDPQDFELRKDQPVIVETSRGTEFGLMAEDVREASDEELAELKSPLMAVVRPATEDDEELEAQLKAKGAEALPLFKELAAELSPDMHPIAVQFLFDQAKAVFYFEADERVDFRALVRELASRFRVRVDMRQVGVRDKARMIGGIGHCGQEICCRRLGGEFCPVSIRMAKDQDLSLNPQKISGLCGRLMCCLRYEFETYKSFKSQAPKLNATVQTPDGPAKVTGLDTLLEQVTVRREEEPPLKVDLSGFEPPEEGARPKIISEAGWNEALERTSLGAFGHPMLFETPKLTATGETHAEEGSDAEREEGRSERRRKRQRKGGKNASQKAESPEVASETAERKSRRKRRRSDQDHSAQSRKKTPSPSKAEPQDNARKRRRSTTITNKSEGEAAKQTNPKSRSSKSVKSRPRPGQKSSGLRRSAEGSQNVKSGDKGDERR